PVDQAGRAPRDATTRPAVEHAAPLRQGPGSCAERPAFPGPVWNALPLAGRGRDSGALAAAGRRVSEVEVDRSPSTRVTSSLVAAGILLSRIAGLIRTRVFAHYMGASLYA